MSTQMHTNDIHEINENFTVLVTTLKIIIANTDYSYSYDLFNWSEIVTRRKFKKIDCGNFHLRVVINRPTCQEKITEQDRESS